MIGDPKAFVGSALRSDHGSDSLYVLFFSLVTKSALGSCIEPLYNYDERLEESRLRDN